MLTQYEYEKELRECWLNEMYKDNPNDFDNLGNLKNTVVSSELPSKKYIGEIYVK
jgi:hypothetical protein